MWLAIPVLVTVFIFCRNFRRQSLSIGNNDVLADQFICVALSLIPFLLKTCVIFRCSHICRVTSMFCLCNRVLKCMKLAFCCLWKVGHFFCARCETGWSASNAIGIFFSFSGLQHNLFSYCTVYRAVKVLHFSKDYLAFYKYQNANNWK